MYNLAISKDMHAKLNNVKWPSHYSVWALRMPAYDDFLAFAVIRWCTSAARRELVAWTFRARCHTDSYVGACSIRRYFMHAEKFSAYADVRPIRSEHSMHTLCERSTRPRRGRRTLTERRQYADVGGHKICQFHADPSARVLNVLSAYGLRAFSVRLPYKNR